MLGPEDGHVGEGGGQDVVVWLEGGMGGREGGRRERATHEGVVRERGRRLEGEKLSKIGEGEKDGGR